MLNKIILHVFCLLLFGLNKVQAQSKLDSIVKVKVYALNPCVIPDDFHCNEACLRKRVTSDKTQKEFVKSFLSEIIGSDKRIKAIIEKTKFLIPLKCTGFEFFCRVILDIYYQDGHKEVLYLDDAYRQFIFYNGVKYERNFALFKAITNLLPRKFRKCIVEEKPANPCSTDTQKQKN